MRTTACRAAATALLAVAGLLLGAPALAHPAVVPDEVPLAGGEVELVLPHGCAREGIVPDDGVGMPTDEVVVASSFAGVTLTALPVTGWEVLDDLETGEAGWRHGGEGHAGVVRLGLAVVGDGTPRTARILVHQACDDVAHRWVQDVGETPSAVLGVGAPATLTAEAGGHGNRSARPAVVTGLVGVLLAAVGQRGRRRRGAAAASTTARLVLDDDPTTAPTDRAGTTVR